MPIPISWIKCAALPLIRLRQHRFSALIPELYGVKEEVLKEAGELAVS